jgi:hypothetical protein
MNLEEICYEGVNWIKLTEDAVEGTISRRSRIS